MGFETGDNGEGFDEAPRSYLGKQRRNSEGRLKILPLAIVAAAVVVLFVAGTFVLMGGNDEKSEMVSNKKTLEIGDAGNLPEAPPPQVKGTEPSNDFGADKPNGLESALSDLETTIDENHAQLMKRLAELGRRVVENTEQNGEVLRIIEKLQTRLEKLEGEYEQTPEPQSAEAPETQKKTPRVAPGEKQKTVSGSAGSKVREHYYTVKENDTLYSIAKDNGIKLETLLKINGLDRNSVIHPGDRLKINP